MVSITMENLPPAFENCRDKPMPTLPKLMVPQEGFEPQTPSLRITYLAFQFASSPFRVFPSITRTS
jgi:hypothetical protein